MHDMSITVMLHLNLTNGEMFTSTLSQLLKLPGLGYDNSDSLQTSEEKYSNRIIYIYTSSFG